MVVLVGLEEGVGDWQRSVATSSSSKVPCVAEEGSGECSGCFRCSLS